MMATRWDRLVSVIDIFAKAALRIRRVAQRNLGARWSALSDMRTHQESRSSPPETAKRTW